MRSLSQRAAALVAAALCAGANAQLIAYDGFGNGPLSNLGGSNGGVGWTGPWQDLFSSLVASVGGTGLSYPGLETIPGAATAPGGTLPDLMDYRRPFATPTGEFLYVSVLIRPEVGFSNWHMVRLGDWPMQVDLGVPMGYYSYGLAIGDYWTVGSGVPTVAGQTVLLVLEMHVDAAAHQTVYSLFVNPATNAPKPAVPSAAFSRALVIPLLGGLETRGEGGFTFDELRVGTTWESVLPLACYANCDGSITAPILNVLDFSCFINRFAAGDPYANCDFSTTPPVLNVQDFSCFINRFAAGCS